VDALDRFHEDWLIFFTILAAFLLQSERLGRGIRVWVSSPFLAEATTSRGGYDETFDSGGVRDGFLETHTQVSKQAQQIFLALAQECFS
jgi:hypothetical protein